MSGKRALVTGSSSGLGAAISGYLAAEGAAVVVHGRDATRAGTVADLTTDDGAEATLAGGPIDILIDNAGSYDYLSWADASARAAWARTYEVDVISGVRMIHRFVPGMRDRGWGRVVTIGGGLAIEPTVRVDGGQVRSVQ
ncbi:SDR family NAD(P)-dependent oxidoreductase [Amycolatopsis sp. lyj-23]|uniref:SDR family NAD(P)-dependent oxidoreductase n=1 Tax=Amycolatopsis sp. lyj-23 TaxID=2789283 RepID=UPI00397CC666